MKITRFEVIPLKQRGLLLKVHTDSELVGYGSPMNYEHGRTVAGPSMTWKTTSWAAIREAVGPEIDVAVDFHRAGGIADRPRPRHPDL